jgi:anti-anti-sigma factor
MSHPDARPAVARACGAADGDETIELEGELDYDTVEDLYAVLQTVLARAADGTTLALDCARLEFCDSSGLAALLTAQRGAAMRGARLVLREPPTFLVSLLDVTGVRGLFFAAQAAPAETDTGFPGPVDLGPLGGAEILARGPAPLVRLYGELDADCAEDVRLVLDEALAVAADGLSLDLTELRFADSSALHLLLDARSRSVLRLLGPLQPEIRLLFEATGLSEAFGLADGGGSADRRTTEPVA